MLDRSPKLTTVLIASSLAAALILNVPHFFKRKVVWSEEAGSYRAEYTDVAGGIGYYYYYSTLVYPVLTIVVPFAAVVVLSALIVLKVRSAERARRDMAAAGRGREEGPDDGGGSSRSSRRQSRAATRVLLLIAWMFLLCHLSRLVELASVALRHLCPQADACRRAHVAFDAVTRPFGHTLVVLNSSCNVVIYVWKDPLFRETLKQMVLKQLRIR